MFEAEAEDLRDTGDWKQFTLYTQGLFTLTVIFSRTCLALISGYSVSGAAFDTEQCTHLITEK